MYDSHPIPIGRGLNLRDMPEKLADGEATVLKNFVAIGEGRVAPRKAFVNHLSGVTGDVIGLFPLPVGLYDTSRMRGGVLLSYDDSVGTTYLYDVDLNGLNPVQVGSLWTGGTARPRVLGARLGRTLFLCDEARAHGLSTYDGAGTISHPTFAFEAGTPAKIVPRCLAQHANQIFVAGYGSEASPNQPELVRFSYLGLANDEEGVGDAGTGASADLFDIGDQFALTEAGVPVVGMASGAGRLIISTPYNTSLLYGTDRTSFGATLIDNERGLVNSLAMIEAAGSVWGWSAKHGPWVFDGQMRDLSRKLKARLDEIGHQLLFAAHAPSAKEVRWHYSPNNAGDPTHCVAWNYEEGEWREHPLPFSVICFGSISPYWSPEDGSGSGGGEQSDGPAGAPSGLANSYESSSSARSTWTNGDTTPTVETDIEREVSGAGYAVVATVGSGVVAYNHSGLAPSTTYNVRVRHKKNGQYSSYSAVVPFTTQADSSPPNAPTNLTVAPLSHKAYLTWELSNSGVEVEVHRSTDGTLYSLVHTTPPDATSWQDASVSRATTYWYKVRAKNSDGTSSFSSAESVEIP